LHLWVLQNIRFSFLSVQPPFQAASAKLFTKLTSVNSQKRAPVSSFVKDLRTQFYRCNRVSKRSDYKQICQAVCESLALFFSFNRKTLLRGTSSKSVH
jgi:hypothetical protein